LLLPFRPAHEIINQRADQVREEDDEDLDDFVVALAGFLGGTVHQHPDPEGEEQHPDQEDGNHYQKWKENHGFAFR
jgi:hypothetical protein